MNRPARRAAGNRPTRGTVAPSPAKGGQATGVADSMWAMVSRMLALYCLLAVIPLLGVGSIDACASNPVWLLIHAGGLAAATGALLIQGLRRRIARGAWAAYALLTLSAVATAPWACSAVPSAEQPWQWWLFGQAVLCAGLAGGLRAAVGYGVVLAAAYAHLRLSPAGGMASVEAAIGDGVFGTGAALAVLGIALGMITSAEAADRMAERLHQREVDDAVSRSLSAERARLDRLIHDDVLTALSAAAHASDPVSVASTADLAKESLARIEALNSESHPDRWLPLDVFASLAERVARRVGPQIEFIDKSRGSADLVLLPLHVVDALLGGLREALRNATRHAAATTIQVRMAVRTHAVRPLVTVSVCDDGSGFDMSQIPADRLGVRLSMTEGQRRAGVKTQLSSAPGSGTAFEMSVRGSRGTPARPGHIEARGEDTLPAEFPERTLTGLLWAVVGAEMILSLLDAQVRAGLPVAALAGLALVLATGLLVRVGSSLTMPVRWAALSVVLIWSAAWLMSTVVSAHPWPGTALWHLFPIQLLLVTLIIRGRSLLALLTLAGLVAIHAAWSLPTPLGWGGVWQASFGALVFTALAFLVRRILSTITVRERFLRAQQRAAVEQSAERDAAGVQRAMWIQDLRSAATAPLTRIAGLQTEVPDELRRDALVVEAALRETLVARAVMSEELAALTEAARRRGVEVRFVDNRNDDVPQAAERAVVDRIREVLSSTTVGRLVVRLGPPGTAELASVVSEDAGRTQIATIASDGTTRARSLDENRGGTGGSAVR